MDSARLSSGLPSKYGAAGASGSTERGRVGTPGDPLRVLLHVACRSYSAGDLSLRPAVLEASGL